MNASDMLTERDAAWFEEAAEVVERTRATLKPQAKLSHAGDIALSLIALVDSGTDSMSAEFCSIVHCLLKQAERWVNTYDDATTLIALARSGHAVRANCGEFVHNALNRLLDSQHPDGGWSVEHPYMEAGSSCPVITGCVLEALGHFGFRSRQSLVRSAVKFVLAEQSENGAWGADSPGDVWQVLAGLEGVGFDMSLLPIQRAIRWLRESQHADGGWGEHGSSSTHTAWAVLALLTGGEAAADEVRAGAEFLLAMQPAEESWSEEKCYTMMALGRYLREWNVQLNTITLPARGDALRNLPIEIIP